ncbi:MAG TPA: hypothetical protein VMF08_18425 [Candidatus Sulfotelmatobacter sp.]|nr:hypothetical protein [Candidatus Sulfotelmatobacter sp.]
MRITVEEIKRVVLAEDDFGHELRVGAILANAKPKRIFGGGIQMTAPVPVQLQTPEYGGTYSDPASKKTAQFDYRCRLFKSCPGNLGSRHILMAVECKSLDSGMPLLVCGRRRTADESFHDFIQVTEKKTVQRVSAGSSFYKQDGFVGKNVIRIKANDSEHNHSNKHAACREGESEIYAKWSRALASARDMAYGSLYGQVNDPLPPDSVAFVMPIVVLPDGALWKAEYDAEGKLAGDPAHVTRCEYYVGHRLDFSPTVFLTHIHFMTLAGLSETMEDLLSFETTWTSTFSPQAKPSPHSQQP